MAGKDQGRGNIIVGKSADLIVLDRNIFDIPAEEVGDIKVLRIVFEGRTVYLAESGSVVDPRGDYLYTP
ncbi:hypothetical protein Rhow_000702 [Rhodococcus wratislaviensis]|uniref:Amidohydrolase 3 domain-containing protein n=1 Tax=Rhodococcus wratislaviensis TaxID=44752 RepID=A0A402CMZ6_RHOWR|nr:hypothetical protein Rhow_000702 [Rhodococcus wratislaviensis]